MLSYIFLGSRTSEGDGEWNTDAFARQALRCDRKIEPKKAIMSSGSTNNKEKKDTVKTVRNPATPCE